MPALARDVGTEVPLTEVLDPRAWAETHFWPVLATLASTPDVRQLGRTLLDSLPEAAVSWALRAGLSHVETQLGLSFGLIRYAADPVGDNLRVGVDYDAISPALSYTPNARSAHGYEVRLPGTVYNVTRVRVRVLGSVRADITQDDADSGVIQVVDAAQGRVLVRPGASAADNTPTPGFWGAFYAGTITIPGAVLVDYDACNVSHLGRPGYVPTVVADFVRLWAGVRICNQAGTFSTRGVTSASIGFDGFSKSNSFQASAMYGVNSALETVYKDQMDKINLDRVRLNLRGIKVFGYGR